ncbi:MAG: arginase family protein [Acidimicrobiia bacterium]|nr:arginase family protein [Acidimicrobiia bacterium]
MVVLAVPYFMGDEMGDFEVPKPHDMVTPSLPDASPTERMAVLYGSVAEWVEQHEHPVVYAGDCVVIVGVLAGLQAGGIHPTLVFFDAHGDFHTWESSQSGFIGGMPLAMATGRGEQTVVIGAGQTPLDDSSVVLVDARDLDRGEDVAVAASGITVCPAEQVGDAIPDVGPLYVHVDVDVVDPEDMPAVNYPAPGGPSLETVAAAVAALASTGRVVAFSVSSWNPALPGSEVAAAATRRLASPFLR